MRKGERGVTLIEMLAVLVIIGLIAAIVVPSVMYFVKRAHYKATQIQVVELANQVKAFRFDQGRWPASLNDLVVKPAGVTGVYPSTGYLDGRKKVPDDAWGRPFLYAVEGDDFTITSYGATGAPGGDGLDSTITNHDTP